MTLSIDFALFLNLDFINDISLFSGVACVVQSYVFGESVGSILGVTTLVGIESIILSKTEGNNFFSISFLSDYFDFEKLMFRSLFIILIFGMKSRVIRLWLKIVGVVVPL